MTQKLGETSEIRPEQIYILSLVKESAVICQLPLEMADEIDVEKGRISKFQRHVTLTVTLDRAIWHTVVHHSSTMEEFLTFYATVDSQKST